jgi:hypothetical protein
MDIKKNIASLKQQLPLNCTLVAVSKTQPIDVIMEAYEAGHRIFGENKVQELVSKSEALPSDIQWHMIGHLQSNKVKYIASFIHLIHSVDSYKLLAEINKQAIKAGRTIQCLLQIHIAKEESKFGFSEAEVLELLHQGTLEKLSSIRITGLMGMATNTSDTDQVRDEFRTLKKFYDQLKSMPLPVNMELKELSMGMSGDYKLAVEEGSTLVRIGSAIFGERLK